MGYDMHPQIDLTELQQLGLTERESKVYVAMVSRGPVLPREIPALAAIPRAKTYETLHRLLHLGLITERRVERKKLYEAVRPDDAIQHLLTLSERETEARRQTGVRLEAQLMAVYHAGRPHSSKSS